MPPAPSSKKRRRTSEAADFCQPIVFISPGNKPDVRLMVFKQAFHVHSHILKERSNFFRKFLDSPDKQDVPVADSALFKYEYRTVVDDDGTWGLEPVATATSLTNETMSQVKKLHREIECFGYLLCAMYNRPYKINRVEELEVLTRHADFYCALPVVSATLTNALLGSLIFEPDQTHDPYIADPYTRDADKVILLAFKLRHSALFREYLIHVVSNWKRFDLPVFFPEIHQHATIRPLIQAKYLELCEKVMDASHAILAGNMTNYSPVCTALKKTYTALFDMDDDRIHKCKATEFAAFYYHLREAFESQNFRGTQLDSVMTLLKNNLIFDRSKLSPGKGMYTSCFLCTEIADEEMPWDTTAVDW